MRSIDYMPNNLNQIQSLGGSWYEGYAVVTNTDLIENKDDFLKNWLDHAIASFREKGFFVKRVYFKWYVYTMDCSIYAFELIKLRETKIELI